MISFSRECFRRILGGYFRQIYHKRSFTAGDINCNMNEQTRLVWVDLEMTGLDAENDKIMEIACLVTDKDLNLIAEGPDILIHQPDSVLEAMNDWCKKHHGQSGLTKGVRESSISVENAEDLVLKFVKQYTTAKNCLLAGNSVHVDKAFLNKYMPTFMDHLHYRIIDVSTIKELCRYWYPETFQQTPKKAGSHRALDDIKESLQELKFYKSSIFK